MNTKENTWIPHPFEIVTWGTDLVTVLNCNLGGKCSITLNGRIIKNIDVDQIQPITLNY